MSDRDIKTNKSIVPTFVIKYPNEHQIFDKYSNKVNGQAEIYFHKPCSGIKSIVLGFKGDLRERPPVADSKHFTVDNKIGILFDYSETVFPENSNDDSLLIPEDTALKFPIEFEFPSKDHDLPTSCNSWRDIITVRYEVYLRLMFKDPSGKVSYTDFLCPLKFQGGSFQKKMKKNALQAGHCLFKNKKMLLEPDGNEKMVPVEYTASKGKGLSKILKSRNPKSKDIELSISIDLTPNINVLSRVFETPITIKCMTKLKPEMLQYKGESTKLGYFEIEAMQISLKLPTHTQLTSK
ncbi:unnamed protein product [Ambrosiozyma monospora]|uniref:Unnamed protein product n=1 Tax=Ambrosiozyma monospora TaxID=43982 RepID=A0ACB5U0L3_AMBMO|nr:unnamed protein product [Ambrosiozyma monospora]